MAEPLSDLLGGSLKVMPGRACPDNLLSTRPDWMQQLTQGKPATAVPALLASLFNLCGHAHRLCAGLAIQAARGEGRLLSSAEQHSLQAETLREHLRRMTLDWPLQLTASEEARARFQAEAHQTLRACPALHAPEDAPMLDWLDQHLLGVPARQWLDGWEQSAHAWMSHWCASTPLWLSELLHGAKAAADTPMTGDMQPLRLHGSPQDLALLAAQLQGSPSFTRQPHWQDQCAETGPWTRLNQQNPEIFNTPWLRLGARLAELVRLSLPDEEKHSGSHWLQTGSLALGGNAGLAWVEMARGLLVHVIQLDSPSADAHVQLYRVLAPTEWNFHPHGAVARQLETMPALVTSPIERTIRALMTAFDPCVRFELPASPLSLETKHA